MRDDGYALMIDFMNEFVQNVPAKTTDIIGNRITNDISNILDKSKDNEEILDKQDKMITNISEILENQREYN